MKYAPPVKARDENYDVHPPLNQRPAPQTQAKTEQKQEPKKEQKTEKKEEK